MVSKEIRHVVSEQRKVEVTRLGIEVENECGLYQQSTLD
jgi:hypothetical protein